MGFSSERRFIAHTVHSSGDRGLFFLDNFIHQFIQRIDISTPSSRSYGIISLTFLLMSRRNRLLHCPQSLSNDFLAIPSHLLRMLDRIGRLKHLLNLLERQARHLGVKKDNQDPPNTADGGVEAECAGGRQSLHHGQESAGDDDIGPPARAGQPHGAHSTDFHGEEIGGLGKLLVG
jgi:hypothetical protein